jgi:nucleoside-diphosphate-sugar epimerase
MKQAQKILIAGFGDIGKRVAARIGARPNYHVVALARKINVSPRDPSTGKMLRVKMIRGDLSSLPGLKKLPARIDTLLHFAPPPSFGTSDRHTKNLLASLERRNSSRRTTKRATMLPRRIVYISTTGVYGNCHGEFIDETRPARPESARARRRVDAERQLFNWGRTHGVAVTVLRAPGIYAADRLPLERLKRQTPVLVTEDDVFTNHIHADDLARSVVLAIQQQRPKRFRVFNVVDDSQLRMGDYFDLIADTFSLARPPRIRRLEAQEKIAPMLLSFMGESRRIGNQRIKRELKFKLKYPTLESSLADLALVVRCPAGS